MYSHVVNLEEGQTFLSLYLDPGKVEYSNGSLAGNTSARSGNGETKTLGQVPTPLTIAHLMARWVASSKPAAVLDPAAGLGSLLYACAELCPEAQLVGVERDDETFERAKNTAPKGAKLVLADYLFSEAGQFPAIIANPPYVKSQRLEYSEAEWRYFDERFGMRLDRLTNLYAIFLLKIWDDLAPGGRAAVLLPAEFLNANFGVQIKARILSEMKPAGLVVFAPELNLFPDALTTSAIIFLERSQSKNGVIHAIKASSVADAEAFVGELLGGNKLPAASKWHDLRAFAPEQKWLNVLLEDSPSPEVHQLTKTIGDYFQCRRGIATGANDYFCLNRAMLREHRLGEQHVESCVTKATDASGMVFTAKHLASLAAADRRCYLLNPRTTGVELDDYLRTGELLGIPQRHLPSHRPVWYRPENRAVAEIWVAVFSRETVKFILNRSSAKNLTCFHGLYARESSAHLAPLLVLFLNSSWGRIAFSQVNRFYGDGLNKLEPKDVEAMPCPAFPPQSAEQAQQLTARLIELELLPEVERRVTMNKLVAELLNLSFSASCEPTAKAAKPFAPLPHPKKTPRRVAPQKRRAAQVL